MNIWEKIDQAYMNACRSTGHLGVATNQGESQSTEDLLQRLAYAQGASGMDRQGDRLGIEHGLQ